MTEITTFTKEQLIGIIESADDVLQALAGTHDDIHPDSDKMCEAWNYLNDNAAPPAVVKRLAEIALAALTADVEAWTDEDELEEMHQCGVAKIFRSRQMMGRPDPNRVVKLCRLPLLESLK
ncbi:TPA: hypothetical protein ACGBT8_004546 [Citrobacter freundii]